MAKIKKTKINTLDIAFVGIGLVATYFIYQAVTGKIKGNYETPIEETGSGNTTGGSSPAPTFPTIVFPFAGSYNTVSKWVQGWQTYAMASCYTDCSWRYDILKQTQEKLNDTQIKQVSDGLKSATGKNMYQVMDNMTWFGGPYSDNKATALWERVKNMSL